MKNFQSEINRIVPATLPALLLTLRFRDAFLAGVCVGVGCWVTIIFFRLTRNLFPKILLEVAFVLWLIALAQMMWYWKELSPYWVISLFLLAFNEVLKGAATPILWKSLLTRSLIFLAILIYLGGIQQILGDHLSIGIFQQPIGSFLLLAAVVFLVRAMKPNHT